MVEQTPLGKTSEYPERYDPAQLAPLPRAEGRGVLGIAEPLPFVGEDIWTAYELSWLNERGKPVVAVGEFRFPCTSSHLIESKSFKLYLNSFNQERYASLDAVRATLMKDLTREAGGPVEVVLFSLDEHRQRGLDRLPGVCIDDLDIAIERYQPDSTLLSLRAGDVETTEEVAETVHSHLLRSKCPVTGQPDWASVVVEYRGAAICHESLLRYIVSFRQHQDFHEQCVERIFCDVMARCRPSSLNVYARYTRRGGLDINPWRSSDRPVAPVWRLERQ